MSLSQYLVPRGKRGTWQLRMAVPTEFRRKHGGPSERTRSLKTTDRDLAARRAMPIIAEWQAEWHHEDNVEKLPAPSAKIELSDLAVEVGYGDLLNKLEKASKDWPDDSYEMRATQRRADLREWVRDFRKEDFARWRTIADNVISNRRLGIPQGSEAYDDFVLQLAHASIDAMGVHNRRIEGQFEADATSSLVSLSKQRSSLRAMPGESILELYDKYAKWKGEPGRQGRRRPELFVHDRVVVELFAEFVGLDRAVASISRDEAKQFRALLTAFPTGRGKNKRLSGSTIDEAIAIAEREGLKTLSLTTQAKYISILRPFFAWLANDSPVAIAENIFDGLNHKIVRGENRRPSFSADQLNSLLASPLFAHCGGEKREHLKGDIVIRDWRYWIPLLCMFTGSRVSEIAQLSIHDIAVKKGVPLMLLMHDPGKGQLIKNKKKRLVAIHPELYRCGLKDYWERQCRRGDAAINSQLFPELKPDARGYLGAYPARWLREHLDKLGIKKGNDGLGAHSFRHTLADALRNAGYMDLEFGQLVLGHSNNTTTAGYGAVPQGTPERLQRMIIDAFKADPFEKVSFSPIFKAANPLP